MRGWGGDEMSWRQEFTMSFKMCKSVIVRLYFDNNLATDILVTALTMTCIVSDYSIAQQPSSQGLAH